ncbi:hypothetical protein I4I83_15765 [Acidovorax cattleyae]|nr:hypothetical protein [Paracidovorax cattleyae]
MAASPLAHAASDFQLDFTFGGQGRNPSVATMKAYIMGCLPAGSRTWGGDPADSAGPWDVEVPAVRGHEYDARTVRSLLLGRSCQPVRPAKVTDVTVTPE